MENYHDINTFKLGDIVNVGAIPEFQKVKIERISDTGVTINGANCAKDIIISGKSPAILVQRGKQIFVEDKKEEISILPGNVSNNEIQVTGQQERVKRGTYTEKMKNLILPEKDKPFTIAEFALTNGIPTNYAYNWVKENCKEGGKAVKPEGQRGKPATLYIY